MKVLRFGCCPVCRKHIFFRGRKERPSKKMSQEFKYGRNLLNNIAYCPKCDSPIYLPGTKFIVLIFSLFWFSIILFGIDKMLSDKIDISTQYIRAIIIPSLIVLGFFTNWCIGYKKKDKEGISKETTGSEETTGSGLHI